MTTEKKYTRLAALLAALLVALTACGAQTENTVVPASVSTDDPTTTALSTTIPTTAVSTTQTTTPVTTTTTVPPTTTTTVTTTTATSADGFQPGRIYSKYVLLYRVEDGEVIYEQAADKRMYPASMTKMMTMWLAIRHLPLEQEVTVSADIFPALYEASKAGFQPGEVVTVKDLLYGAMLPSGGEAAVMLAVALDGSEAAFAERMNQEAQRIGMADTHFVNATGLHDDNHYSTARDVLLLLRTVLQNETFREIFSTAEYTTSPTNLHPNGLHLRSTFLKHWNPALLEDGKVYGGKTGFTDQAGRCLASAAEKHGLHYLLVTAGADGSHHITDAQNIYGRYLP